jgi:uncharacterized protein (DUF1786 family)
MDPMPTRSLSQDRRRISRQPHELSYAGKKLGRGGTVRVIKAKRDLGSTTSRTKVMARARSRGS